MNKKNTLLKRSIICLSMVVGVSALALWSCSNPATTQTNASVILDIYNGGCNVIATYDGGSPVTETTTGSFTIYNNIPNGSHSVSIYAPTYGSGTCTFNFTGASHEIAVLNACGGGAFQVNCN